MKELLVVIDMQVDFVSGSLGTKEALGIVPNVEAKIKEYIDKGIEVIFTRDTHQPNYLETLEGKNLPVEHCIEGTSGWEIIKELKEYSKNKKIFDKETFGSVELMNYVKSNSYDIITLMGLCTDICVISNAVLIKAALPESVVRVIADCSAGVTPSSHNNSLEAMKMCQIEVM